MAKYNEKNKYTLGTLLLLSCSVAWGVQPLSESDMDDVSVETGQNILDIFGPASAGLADDIDTEKNTDQDDDETRQDAVRITLEDRERDASEFNPVGSVQDISFEEAQAAIEASAKTTGSANVFETSSEINYSDKDFNREEEFLADGTIVHTRDLQVDLLKLENLRGDYNDGQRSAGSIYLSDWHSRGSTRMQEKN